MEVVYKILKYFCSCLDFILVYVFIYLQRVLSNLDGVINCELLFPMLSVSSSDVYSTPCNSIVESLSSVGWKDVFIFTLC